jgi:hypothetical protein
MNFWDLVMDTKYRQHVDVERIKEITKDHRVRMFAKTRDIEGRLDVLEGQLGEVALLCRSLLTILRETKVVDPAAFEGVLKRIDEEDGVADGRVSLPDPEPQAIRSRSLKKRLRRRGPASGDDDVSPL